MNIKQHADVSLTNYSINEIGGLVYLLKYANEIIPYTILNVLGTIFGCLGNILIIGSIILSKELHTITNMLIFNLSLADLIISGFVNLFTLVGVFAGKSFFDKFPWVCELIGAICLISCVASLMNIGFLAINRYFIICHRKIYAKIFTVNKTIVYCILNWIIGVLIDLPNLMGWGGHYYDLKTLSCVWNRLKSYSYTIFFSISCIIIPCICILFCYLKIFNYARISRNKVFRSASKIKTRNHHIQKSIRLAKGLFSSFILFTICWVPYGIIILTDFSDSFPRIAHMYPIAIAHFNSTLNPIFYAMSNTKFKRGYRKFIKLILLKLKLIDPSQSSLTTS